MRERIKAIRKAAELTQSEFGDKIGVKGNTVTGYESGLRSPSDAVIKSICREFNVNEVWLMGYNVPMDRNFGRTKTKHINVYNLSTNEVVQTIPYEYRPDISEDNPKNFFAIYATDNSMAPLLDVGDIAIIKKHKEFSNKKTYLLKIKNGNPIIRKVIQSDDGRIELQAMNMWNFPPQTDLTIADIEILGEVIKVENNSAFK